MIASNTQTGEKVPHFRFFPILPWSVCVSGDGSLSVGWWWLPLVCLCFLFQLPPNGCFQLELFGSTGWRFAVGRQLFCFSVAGLGPQ